MLKKRTKITIIAVSAGCVVLIAALAAFLGIFLSSKFSQAKNADYYVLGEDQIPSIKLVVGPRTISGMSTEYHNGTQTMSYTYQSDSAISDVENYIAYLVDEAGFVPIQLNEWEDRIYYAKESAEDGKLLLVDIYNSGFTYDVTIHKGAGTLEP